MKTIDYEISGGCHIGNADQEMIALAKKTGARVKGTFNGIGLICGPDNEYGSLERFFNKTLEKQRIEYQSSEKFLEDIQWRERESAERKEKARGLMEELLHLGEAPIEDVVGWLNRFEKIGGWGDTGVPYSLILKWFTAHGYEPDVNCDEAFNGEDADNFARYLIGQALSCMKSGMPIHQVYGYMAEKWFDKFHPNQKYLLRKRREQPNPENAKGDQ